MPRFQRTIWLVTVLAAGLGGCGGDIYRTVKLNPDVDQANSIVTDARQRLISITSLGVASRPGLVDPNRIMCVEPSPDVAVAVANSMGAAVGVTGKGSFSISGAEAEGLAQIAERTTAIQALLRQGYQACIDYMNGAITGTTYSLRQSRLDDLLVTMVLAEDASGAFGRSGAKIGTKAEASAEAAASMLPNINQGLDQANKALNEKQQNVDLRKQELADAEKALEGANDTNRTDLTNKRNAAREKYNQAVAERDAMLRSVTGLTEAASKASAGVTEVAGMGGLTVQPDPEIARTIAQMQETFVTKDMEQAYLSTCLIELGQWKIRDKEDNEFRELMKKRLEKTYNDKDFDRFSTEEMEDFYLATQVGQNTLLTKHCEENLDAFLFQAQANENARKVMRLQLESQRLQLERDKLSNASQLGVEAHPQADLKTATQVKDALVAARNALPATAPATAPAQLVIDLKAAKERADQVINVDAKILTDLAADATRLEAEFLAAVTDPRKTAPTESEDHQNWVSKYNLQQKEASLLSDKFTDFTRRARRALSEAQTVADKIKALGP